MSDDIDLNIEDILGGSFDEEENSSKDVSETTDKKEISEKEIKPKKKPEEKISEQARDIGAILSDNPTEEEIDGEEVQEISDELDDTSSDEIEIGDPILNTAKKTKEKPVIKEKKPEEKSVVTVSKPEEEIDDITPLKPKFESDENDKTKNDGEETAEVLAKRLQMWNKSCRDLFVDLRMFDFNADDEEMCLISQDKEYFDRPLYFKVNPENPRDPKIQLAQKQFCKFVGVPHGFFMNNRPALRNEIVKTWQAGLDTDDKKARCIARVRESQEYCVIRALLPEANNLLQNHELMSLIDECSRESVATFFLEFSTGDTRDDLILHARFLSNQSFKVADTECRLGFSITASELGASPLVVDTLLHHTESKTAFIASYGSEPFFSSKYEGIQAHEIKDMLPNMIERLLNEGSDMKDRIESEFRQVEPHEECIMINTWGGIPRKFKRALFHEASAQEDDMRTSWDFARHMCLIAKDFDSQKRLRIERAAGYYLNLAFGKD
jgi:hypothetical protein